MHKNVAFSSIFKKAFAFYSCKCIDTITLESSSTSNNFSTFFLLRKGDVAQCGKTRNLLSPKKKKNSYIYAMVETYVYVTN